MKRLKLAGKINDAVFALSFLSNWFGNKRLVDITDEEFNAVYSKFFFLKQEEQKQNGRSN